MQNRKVVSWRNLPARAPLLGTCVLYLMLDKFNAPGWAWGVLGTFAAVLWLAFFVDVFNRENIDIVKQ